MLLKNKQYIVCLPSLVAITSSSVIYYLFIFFISLLSDDVYLICWDIEKEMKQGAHLPCFEVILLMVLAIRTDVKGTIPNANGE